MALNTRQLLFIENYLKTNNATQAAIAAGYSEKTAGRNATRMMKNEEIAARIAERTSAVLETAKMEADEVLLRLTQMARGNIADFITIDSNGEPMFDLSKPGAPLHLIKRIKTKKSARFGDEVEIELYDAQNALNTLGKHWRLFDRAGEKDWREEVEKAGMTPGDLLEAAVREYERRLMDVKVDVD